MLSNLRAPVSILELIAIAGWSDFIHQVGVDPEKFTVHALPGNGLEVYEYLHGGVLGSNARVVSWLDCLSCE